MTYHPLAETHDTGEAYFTSLGLLGASTGMAPIISATTTIPSVDSYSSNLTIAITDSVLKYTQTSSADKHFTYTLGATKTKLLAISYFQIGTSLNAQGISFSQDTWSGQQPTHAYLDNAYYFIDFPYLSNNKVSLLKIVSTTHGWLANDATICVNDDPFAHAYGLAFYCEDHVQKAWVKMGSTSQWLQVFSLTDESLDIAGTPFQSVGVVTGYTSGNVGRMISPFYVWGA